MRSVQAIQTQGGGQVHNWALVPILLKLGADPNQRGTAAARICLTRCVYSFEKMMFCQPAALSPKHCEGTRLDLQTRRLQTPLQALVDSLLGPIERTLLLRAVFPINGF